MGIRLIVEVLDHAPADLTTAERLVLLVLAEDANDLTRAAWPPLDVVADRAGLTENGVVKAIRRLRERGYDVRIPIGTGKDGRPVFAHRGRSTTYGLPKFPTRVSPGSRWRSRARSERVDTEVALSGERVDTEVALSERKAYPMGQKGLPQGLERGAPGVGPSPQSPHIPSSSARASESDPDDDDEWSSTEEHATEDLDSTGNGDSPQMDGKSGSYDTSAAEVARRIGVSPERGQKIADEIRHRFAPRNLTAYLAKMSADRLREIDADIGNNGSSEVMPHYFRKPELKSCRKCDRAFRPREWNETHCPPCTDEAIRNRKSQREITKPEPRQIDPDAPFQPQPRRFGEENRWR